MVDDSHNDRATREPRATRGVTDRAVKALKRAPRRYEVWDDDTPGFGVRVAPSGLKTWILRYRSRGRKRRLKLGNLPSVSLADARRHARQALGVEHRPSKSTPPDRDSVVGLWPYGCQRQESRPLAPPWWVVEKPCARASSAHQLTA
jgi:Arm DNA-binding domain